MTSFYQRQIVPRLISCACSTKPIMKQREKIVPLATGKVLELGIGGGLNLAFYNPALVESVFGVDPSSEMRERAQKAKRPDGLKVEVREGIAEALPFDDASFDTVVSTYTLCSVRAPASALAEVKRVLKPGGRFLFCEHGLAPDPGVATWQRRIEPIWKAINGGCHLTRLAAYSIENAGFMITEFERMYLPGTPKFAGWNEWGQARAA